MANVTITQLPTAGAITGSELVPIVQNGVTVQTTTGAIAASPSQTQTFLTLNQEPTLPNSRRLSGGTGVGLTDAGAQIHPPDHVKSCLWQLGISECRHRSQNQFKHRSGPYIDCQRRRYVHHQR